MIVHVENSNISTITDHFLFDIDHMYLYELSKPRLEVHTGTVILMNYSNILCQFLFWDDIKVYLPNIAYLAPNPPCYSLDVP